MRYCALAYCQNEDAGHGLCEAHYAKSLEAERDRLQRELDAARLRLQSVIGTIQQLQPSGSPPGGGPIVLIPWIVRTTAELITTLRERAEKAEALAETHRLERELQSEGIATLTEERDAANRRSDSWQAAYEGQTRLEADNARLREALEKLKAHFGENWSGYGLVCAALTDSTDSTDSTQKGGVNRV